MRTIITFGILFCLIGCFSTEVMDTAKGSDPKTDTTLKTPPLNLDSIKAVLKSKDSLVIKSCKFINSCKDFILNAQENLDLCNNDTSYNSQSYADGSWQANRSILCTSQYNFYDSIALQQKISSNISLIKKESPILDSLKNDYWKIDPDTMEIDKRDWELECSYPHAGPYFDYKLRQLNSAQSP